MRPRKSVVYASWADILGSIPTTEMEMRVIRGFMVFGVARAVRVARVAKVAKAAKTLKVVWKMPKLRKTVEKFEKQNLDALREISRAIRA